MTTTLHIIGGDGAGGSLAKSGIPGDVFVWHDVLYDGPLRRPGWPDDAALEARAAFLEDATGGGLDRGLILRTLRGQYDTLRAAARDRRPVTLWFDACLFDQSMLAHILARLRELRHADVQLVCADRFPGIAPFHGLGQLAPDQIGSLAGSARPVGDAPSAFAARVDRAFAKQDRAAFAELAALDEAPLPFVPAAMRRWMEEAPDPATGLGRLERLALEAVRAGCREPAAIFKAASAADSVPQYWGDTTLWAKINGLAARRPPLVRIEGPAPRLPQWEGKLDVNRFRVYPC